MSSPVPARQASSSESTEPHALNFDSRKRKRMISNRESARRSRMKKQQHLDELLHQAAKLKNENSQIAMQINLITQQYSGLEAENTILRTQLVELTERLKSVNSVLRFIEEFSGMAMDIPEIPDPLLKPWQLPCPSQPILASLNVFQC